MKKKVNKGLTILTLSLTLGYGCSSESGESAEPQASCRCKVPRVCYQGECVNPDEVPGDGGKEDVRREDAGNKDVEEESDIGDKDIGRGYPERDASYEDVLRDSGPSLAQEPKIFFISDRTGYRNVWRMRTDGSEPVNITNSRENEQQPFVSERGDFLVFAREIQGNWELILKRLDEEGRETNLTESVFDEYSPILAEEGRVIYGRFQSGNSEIFSLNPGPTNLTDSPSNDWDPDIKYDLSQIIFSSDRGGNPDLYVMGPRGGVPTRVSEGAGSNYQPRWSPDGRRVLYQNNREGNFEVYAGELREDIGLIVDSINLSRNPAQDVDARWTRDGEEIVFSSNRDGDYEIYLMGKDGSGQRNLTNHPGDETGPFYWAAD